jgi:glycosyltransferase involved in cell wall biosynthesis
MSEPLVSVMLPAYNQVDFVREAVESAAEQDYSNLEVIVSDDGSTDGTIDVIQECANKYPGRVIPLVNQPHLGITGNCNRNLKACKGKYIAFSAGDDAFLPGKITKQVEWMEEDEQRVLCGHDVDIFDSRTGQTIKIYSTPSRFREGWGATMFVRYGTQILVQSIMVRSKALPTYGFDDRLPIVSDWKLWIDCLASDGLFGYIGGIYSRYGRHDQNITDDEQTLEKRFTDKLFTLAIVETAYPHLVPHCRYFRARVFFDLGKLYLKKRQTQYARNYFLAALRQDFLGSKSTRLLGGILLTFLPEHLRNIALSIFTEVTLDNIS